MQTFTCYFLTILCFFGAYPPIASAENSARRLPPPDAHGSTTIALTASAVVVRLTQPTRAAIDWALWNANPLLEQAPPGPDEVQSTVPAAEDLPFATLFEPNSFVTNPVGISFSESAGASPLAWDLLFPWLEKQAYKETEALSKILPAIQRPKWGRKSPGQRIAAAFFVEEPAPAGGLWLLIEFASGIKVGEGFGDLNGNGQPDFLAKVKTSMIPEDSPVRALIRKYREQTLAQDEASAHFAAVAGLWYNKYDTYSIAPQGWPLAVEDDPDAPQDVKTALEGSQDQALGVLRGRPAGKWIYNILLSGGGSTSRQSSAGTEATAALSDKPEQRTGEPDRLEKNDNPVVAGRGMLFLRKSLEAARAAVPEGEGNDPLAVLAEATRRLADLGVELIIAPVPLKEAFCGDFLPTNESRVDRSVLTTFWNTLEGEGVAVVDLAAVLAPLGSGAFLANDTHWTPEAVAVCAARVASFIPASVVVEPMEGGESGAFDLPGDLRDMLPAEVQREYPPMRVTYRRPPAPPSLVDSKDQRGLVVVADSHGAVFEIGEPGRAGFASHLAAQIGRPVTLISSQGSPNQAFVDLLRRGPEFLEKQEAVVFLFSERFITINPTGWRDFPWKKFEQKGGAE